MSVGRIESPTKLDVVARELDTPIDTAHYPFPEKMYIVTAQGRNRRGLVHGISSFFYRHNINILDLATTRTGNQYTMILQLDLSEVESIGLVREELQAYGEETGLHVVMQHHQLFQVTNEINF